jgi:mannose-1-phosphate guanylyltransferase
MSGPTQLDTERAILLAGEVAECERKSDYAGAQQAYGQIADAIAEARDAEVKRFTEVITLARKHLAKGRALWNGPCHQCDYVLAMALAATPDDLGPVEQEKHPFDRLGEIFTSDEYNQTNRE